MEADAPSSRPESPKKKVKSSAVVESEAQSSDYSESSANAETFPEVLDLRQIPPPCHLQSEATLSVVMTWEGTDQPDHNRMDINGVTPSRKFRCASAPDSSSERIPSRNIENSTSRIQEEEVSSSENSISLTRREMPSSGDADSISHEPEDLTIICDSASSSSTNKH